MSWKFNLFAGALGIGIEIFVAYFLSSAFGLTFLQKINWTSKYVLGFFFGGFLSACWLFYWIKLCHHFFHSHTQATPVVSQVTTKHMEGVSPPTTAVPPQSHAEPVAQPALAVQGQVDSVIQPSQQGPVESGTSESFQSPSVSKPVEPVAAPSASQDPVAPAVPSVHPKTTLTPPKPMSVQTSPMHPAVASPSSSTPIQAGAALGGGLPPVSPVSTGPAGGVPLTATASVSASSVSQKAQDIESLMHIDDTLDMAVFKKVALEGQIIDLVYSSDNDAVICNLLSETHDWVVDISSPIENSVWRNEIGETLTIGATVLKQAALLEKLESDASIVPTIVLMRGSIQNYDSVVNYLLQNHIHLVKYQADEAENVVTLHQLLKKHFSIFPDIQIDDEENEEEDSEDETNDLTEQ